MKTSGILYCLALLTLTTFLTSVRAQEVAIPDPGLHAAIRDMLGKSTGPLTPQDLLSLTNVSASCVKGANQCSFVENLEGLGAAHNLTSLSIGVGGYTGSTTCPRITTTT
ncbi:MAG: hypothetical protein EXS31_08655 [Pedosphaera sp.]|nr:hypothetical protein [Pedosphaera sp.]